MAYEVTYKKEECIVKRDHTYETPWKNQAEIAKRATKDNETNEGEITYGRKKKENELRQRGRSRKSIVKSANAIDD